MATRDDVQKLAALARISLSEESLDKFSKEFDSILSYVGQIESLDTSGAAGAFEGARNVLREDGEPNEKGSSTQKLVAQFPERDGNSLVVKKIISHD